MHMHCTVTTLLADQEILKWIYSHIHNPMEIVLFVSSNIYLELQQKKNIWISMILCHIPNLKNSDQNTSTQQKFVESGSQGHAWQKLNGHFECVL